MKNNINSIKNFFKKKFNLNCSNEFICIKRIKKSYALEEELKGVTTFAILEDKVMFYSYTKKCYLEGTIYSRNFNAAKMKNDFLLIKDVRVIRTSNLLQSKEELKLEINITEEKDISFLMTKDLISSLPKEANGVACLDKVHNTFIVIDNKRDCWIIQKNKIIKCDSLINYCGNYFINSNFLTNNKKFFLINSTIYKLNKKGILCKLIKIDSAKRKVYFENKEVSTNLFAKQKEIQIKFVFEKENCLAVCFLRANVNYCWMIEKEKGLSYTFGIASTRDYLNEVEDFFFDDTDKEIKIIEIDRKIYLIDAKKNRLLQKVDRNDYIKSFVVFEDKIKDLSLFCITNQSRKGMEEKLTKEFLWLNFKGKEEISEMIRSDSNDITIIEGGYWNGGYLIYYKTKKKDKLKIEFYDKNKNFVVNLADYFIYENSEEEYNKIIEKFKYVSLYENKCKEIFNLLNLDKVLLELSYLTELQLAKLRIKLAF